MLEGEARERHKANGGDKKSAEAIGVVKNDIADSQHPRGLTSTMPHRVEPPLMARETAPCG